MPYPDDDTPPYDLTYILDEVTLWQIGYAEKYPPPSPPLPPFFGVTWQKLSLVIIKTYIHSNPMLKILPGHNRSYETVLDYITDSIALVDVVIDTLWP
jgi:hypothetical protein